MREGGGSPQRVATGGRGGPVPLLRLQLVLQLLHPRLQLRDVAAGLLQALGAGQAALQLLVLGEDTEGTAFGPRNEAEKLLLPQKHRTMWLFSPQR